MAKVLVTVAHDDDAILGVGGRIFQHVERGDDVNIIICTDGWNSHQAVLGIDHNPSPGDVAYTRRMEINAAMSKLEIPLGNLYFLSLHDGEGAAWSHSLKAKVALARIFFREDPDIVYFQHADAHVDHRAVGKMVGEILPTLHPGVAAFQFVIWTKELAQGRPEVDASQVPDISSDVIRIVLTEEELNRKRRAMYVMKSQVQVWPYANWQIQQAPILDKKFLDHFLTRPEEILIRYNVV